MNKQRKVVITTTYNEMGIIIDTKAEEVAQPDIIRCKDCEWWDSEYRECHSPNWDTGTDEHFITPPGFFCGWAERRGEQDE